MSLLKKNTSDSSSRRVTVALECEVSRDFFAASTQSSRLPFQEDISYTTVSLFEWEVGETRLVFQSRMTLAFCLS